MEPVRLAVVGLSHKTAGVEIREQASLASNEVPARLRSLVARSGLAEALLLSTCNRSELYVVSDSSAATALPELFAELHGCSLGLVRGHLYVHEDLDAVRHLFRVGAGVESMVFGETEIVGQLKQALECARQAGTATRVLLRLGDRALAVGKRIRTETAVDRGCMSVASVAVELAKQIFDDLSRARILLLGAGDTGALVTRRMIENGARHVVVTSRTASRALEVAQRFGARAIGFDDFPAELSQADIVISCTSARHHLITPERVRQARSAHHHRPLFLIDLAVPRDIDPAVRQLADVYLCDIDDLEGLSQECEQNRRCELPKVEALVEEEARQFVAWMSSLDVVPVMLAIRGQAEAIRDAEVRKLLEQCPELTTRQRKALHLATKRLVRRLLDTPMSNLQALAHQGNGGGQVELVKALFGVGSEKLPPAGAAEAQEAGEDA